MTGLRKEARIGSTCPKDTIEAQGHAKKAPSIASSTMLPSSDVTKVAEVVNARATGLQMSCPFRAAPPKKKTSARASLDDQDVVFLTTKGGHYRAVSQAPTPAPPRHNK